MNLGVIGVDSSHYPVFSKAIKDLHDAGETPCRVVASFDPGDHGWPNADDVDSWRADAQAAGVEEKGSLEELLDAVDGVLVLAVDGGRHLELARPSIERKLPTYVDKPLTCDPAEAAALHGLVQKTGARCYSASSLRFAGELEAIPRDEIGDIVAIDAFGPGELNPGTPGLFHYGVHTLEMVDAIWGPGVKRVSAIETPDRHLVDLDYSTGEGGGDGRYARLRLDRKAAYEFGATVHGTKGVHQFRVDFGPVYGRLVRGMVRFFEGGPAPADLAAIVENVEVMAAGNRSCEQSGAWVEIGGR